LQGTSTPQEDTVPVPDLNWSAAAGSAGRAARTTGTTVRRAAPAVAAAVPVALVNATAFIGQFAWVRVHVPWILPGQVLFAVTLESIAVYLAWHAHLAQLKNDSAGRLRLSAYLFALVIGAMNYSHYAVDWHPNALAVGLGLMSALSPWLWGVHSRRASRDALLAQHLVEPHAVRLGAARWTWHPLRSVGVTSASAWTGENDPQRAIALYDTRRAAKSGAPVLAQAARQDAIEAGAPAAQEQPVPVAAPDRETLERLADAGVVQLAGYVPAGPVSPLPGAGLNGFSVPVRAIADLSAKATMGASHEIDPQRIAEVELHLTGLADGELPSERTVAKMLCADHDHRRQAKSLLIARKAGSDLTPASPRSPRPVNVNGSAVIATPVGTMPGGASANG
jgi:hypothetical protein